MAAPIIYIDEDVGRDDAAAVGSESAPYKTLVHAFLQHAPTTEGIQYLTRKSETDAAGENVDPAAKLEWKPATKSAVKKATNLWEQRKKKAAKEHELAIREKAEADKRQKVLEEAKKVVIKEDASLPPPVRIRLDVTDPAVVQLRAPESDTPGTRVRCWVGCTACALRRMSSSLPSRTDTDTSNVSSPGTWSRPLIS